jgi:hypothetical protein
LDRSEVRIELPGVTGPITWSAEDVKLPDAVRVIGVSAGGRHRAYLVTEMAEPARHVVNDVLGNTPVGIVYCDRADCVRVYDGATGLGVGGYLTEGDSVCMLLTHGGHRYRMDTGAEFDGAGPALPFASGEPVRTTWKAWREEHPDTDVVFLTQAAARGFAR